MAKLALDLSQFKSAGVYTIEIDQSERVVVTTQSLRLFPGFSKVGPFNAPVFIRNTKDLQRFYGDIDKKLERKGSFFHRSIQTALLQSPVFAINLLGGLNTAPDSSLDMSQGISLSLDCSKNNFGVFSDKYVNFFNRERFWKADPEYLLGIASNKEGVSDAISTSLIQVANVGTKTISFIFRKAIGLQGYDVFAKDWYGSDTNIPYEWIRPYDKISDYFINIIAIEGDWTNYTALSTDPYYSNYFSDKGILPSKVNEFINLSNVNLVGSWIGTIIPDFRDKTGANQYIEDIVNSSTQLTGVLLNINKDALDQLIWDEDQQQWEMGDGSSTTPASWIVDLVGHRLIDNVGDVSTSFLSYEIDVSNNVFHATLDITQLDSTGKVFTLDSSSDYLTVGTMVKKDPTGGIPGVTYVISKIYDGSTYKFETAEPIFGYQSTATTIKIQKPIDDPSIATYYSIKKLNGLKLTSNHLPGYDKDGKPSIEEGVEKIYSMLEDSGILRGLTNPEMINYRYIVDTMAYGLRPNCGGKVYLSRLAKKRGKTTAIISAPSIKQFATSQDPYFCDTFIPGSDPKPIFSTEWIPKGGNPDMPRSFKFTLPDEDNGAKYCGVFGPFLRYTEGDTTIDVPPAADVSNTYVRKFLGGDPYAIVANQNGVLSNPNLAGVEYMIDREDRDYLEPFGYNSIIERTSTGQILIYANVTSYQNVKSDYNYLHVREILNTIELQVDEALKNFVFQYNTPVMRLNVVNTIAPILQAIKDSGAIYNYEIIMDESNNTPEITDEGFAIIDIGVWITKGMQKIINRISVNKSGGISSGGFTTI
ncbi:MAG TPA: hypothetical protein P5513_04860 [Candidatus Diapherotrites archaeon]|nr:hypothetical protein [Candidatus Diapherotrites archaeon]